MDPPQNRVWLWNANKTGGYSDAFVSGEIWDSEYPCSYYPHEPDKDNILPSDAKERKETIELSRAIPTELAGEYYQPGVRPDKSAEAAERTTLREEGMWVDWWEIEALQDVAYKLSTQQQHAQRE